MKIIYGLNNLKKQKIPCVVSVGVFDAVHTGHKMILAELIKNARKEKARSSVVTFFPHPDKVLKGPDSVVMLASLKHRLNILEALGIDLCVVINFDKKFSGMNAVDFIRNVLTNRLNMKMLLVGESFSFGKERLSTIFSLSEIAKQLKFEVRAIKPKRHNNRIISSSVIRHLIEYGKLSQAAKLLGRPVSILGTVVKGKGRGRGIGFKTANVDPHHEAIPPSGVYAVYSKLGNKLYKSVLNIGTRPTFDEKEPTIEAHLFNYRGNLYGRDIEIIFKKRLRAERRFKDKEHLSLQIMKDAKLAMRILKL